MDEIDGMFNGTRRREAYGRLKDISELKE